MDESQLISKEIKIMHACELGAVGVYRGHKCVARYVFRQAIPELDDMRSHEVNHVRIFRQLLDDRKSRPCFAYQVFFWGGLFYGVLIGLLGLKAIGQSTNTIESIVIKELDTALETLSFDESIVDVIQQVKIDEMSHQSTGSEIAGERFMLSGLVVKLATAGAYTAKNLASVL